VTIAGCFVRSNPRMNARRHEQVFGIDLAPLRMRDDDEAEYCQVNWITN
jgi:hypothetical protein